MSERQGLSAAEKKIYPIHDPTSTKYPDRVFYWGRWMTAEQAEREYGRYANDLDLRDKKREYQRSRRSDPDFRRRRTLYMMDYHHRRKHERWADQGLTLRNDGKEGSCSGDRAAA